MLGVEGIDLAKLSSHPWEKYSIVVGGTMGRPEFTGLRIAPNVYDNLDEIDTFCSAGWERIEKLS
jgi:hypothetical protein